MSRRRRVRRRRAFDETESEIVVRPDQFETSFIVAHDEVDDVKAVAGDEPSEARLGVGTEAILDQPSNLSDSWSNNREVGPRTEQFCTRLSADD
jgi:hypothetical protein